MVTRPAAKSKRLGKTGDDIFVPHHEAANADRPKKRGRRPSHTEHWTKVTVVLFDRQIVFLDRLGADIQGLNDIHPFHPTGIGSIRMASAVVQVIKPDASA